VVDKTKLSWAITRAFQLFGELPQTDFKVLDQGVRKDCPNLYKAYFTESDQKIVKEKEKERVFLRCLDCGVWENEVPEESDVPTSED